MPTAKNTSSVESSMRLPDLGTVGLDTDVSAALTEAFGLGKWNLDVRQINFPPLNNVNHVVVNADLLVATADQTVRVPAVSYVPVADDPNASVNLAITVAIRSGLRRLGYDVEIPEFDMPKPAPAAPARAASNANSGGGRAPARAPAPPADPNELICADCNREITDYVTSTGKPMSADEQVAASKSRWGAPICGDCGSDRWRNGDRGNNTPPRRSNGGGNSYQNNRRSGGGGNYQRNNRNW